MTSTKLVKAEIKRFLSSGEPEVLCISGVWGTGKTYTWQTMVTQATKANKVKLSSYAYVSLFGIDSLEGLKLAIFENTSLLDQEQADGRLGRLIKRAKEGAWGFSKRHRIVLTRLGPLRDVMDAAGPLFFSTVEDQIVCIDDLERKGANLRVRDVFGLISFLREQRRCKIVLLLNDEELEDEYEDFKRYSERVIDIDLRFTPTPEESVRIALPGKDKTSRKIGEKCAALRISNIRVMKKIERLVRIIEPTLSRFHPDVFDRAVLTLVILGWSKYQPGAPPLEYLERRIRTYYGLGDGGDVTPEEGAWNDLIDAYEFNFFYDLDFALKVGVENGFFDFEAVARQAEKLEQDTKRRTQSDAFREAWNMYHNSFDDNQEQVLDTIYTVFLENLQAVTPADLNATVRLFKELDRPGQAAEMIQNYVDKREGDRSLWDLEEQLLVGGPADPDVEKAFAEKLESLLGGIDPVASFTKIAMENTWSDRDIDALGTLSTDEYYRTFKKHNGKVLSKMIKVVARFGRDSGSSVKETANFGKIHKNGTAALQRIGKESKINALRVRKYSVKIEQPTDDSSISEEE